MTEATAQAGASRNRGFWLKLLVVLVVLLVLLVLILLLLLRPEANIIRGGEVTAGLQPVLTILGPGRGENPDFARPISAAFGPRGRIYAVDTGNNRVVAFSRSGRFLFEFGGLGVAKPSADTEATWEEGLLNFPTGIAVDRDGTVYVADFRNDQIQVFDSDGRFLRRFPDPFKVVGRGTSGQRGTGLAVVDVAVHDGFVYALDAYQVAVFTLEGEFVRQFGRPGTGLGEFDRPNGIAVTQIGRLVVADSNNQRVQAFTSEGDHLWTAGGPDESVFGLPRGVAVLADGTIVVTDSFGFEIVTLTSEGEVLERYGERGLLPGQMNFPDGIDAVGDLIVVADKENNRIQVLEFVR